MYLYEPGSYAPLARVDQAEGEEQKVYYFHTDQVEQNLRFPGQYFDSETTLHYNTFRYYDPECAHFITQGLMGGFNLYIYAPNSTGWLDPLGWCVNTNVTRGALGQPLRTTATITKNDLKTGTATNQSCRAWARMMGNQDDAAGHIIGKLLGGSGGKDGVLPQLSKVNRGLFRDFEKQIAKDILIMGLSMSS